MGSKDSASSSARGTCVHTDEAECRYWSASTWHRPSTRKPAHALRRRDHLGVPSPVVLDTEAMVLWFECAANRSVVGPSGAALDAAVEPAAEIPVLAAW